MKNLSLFIFIFLALTSFSTPEFNNLSSTGNTNLMSNSNLLNIALGTVTSSCDGLPISGVSVVIKDTSIGTIIDFKGKYSISPII